MTGLLGALDVELRAVGVLGMLRMAASTDMPGGRGVPPNHMLRERDVTQSYDCENGMPPVRLVFLGSLKMCSPKKACEGR